MQPTQKPKIDRRVQRTLQSLRGALLELIIEKGYDEISIEEITERANVGRTTFYLHYRDKDDLLLEEFSTRMYERVLTLSEIPFSVWLPTSETEKPLQPLSLVFEHIYENREIYNLLLKSANSSRIVGRIRKTSTDAIIKFVETKMETDPIPILSEVPIEFFAAFFSGALLSIVNWWLKEDMQHSPEEVTDMFRKLFFHGARETLGLSSGKSNN